MKNNKKGFIAISVIYSFFILFVTVMMLIMYSYINDRKTNLKIKSELIDRFRDKSPDIVISQNGSVLPHTQYSVDIHILDGGNGISSAKYSWSESPSAAATTDLESFNETVTSPTEKGNYYLVVTACDVNMYCKTVYTTPFNVGAQNVCLKANTLHNESCSNADSDNYCLGSGLEENSVSIFGTMNMSSSTLKVGDAYDCDVNGDGVYDPNYERFYYISDYYNTTQKKYDNKKAVLIYSNNVKSGTSDNTHTVAYTTASDDVPANAFQELPASTQWSNVSLNEQTRNIVTESGLDIPTDINYSGEEVTYIAPLTGTYKIELWGAQGGTSMGDGSLTHANSYKGGKGGYTSGYIQLTQGDTLYINVGGKGEDAIEAGDAAGGYNGGGSGTHDHADNEAAGAGGGATDVRLVSSSGDSFESLASRIMVAAGGGGAAYNQPGGYAGGLSGEKAYYGTSATQEEGYAFGLGQDGINVIANVEVGGGGGGYYGGYAVSDTQNNRYKSAGGGGSSFVSGYPGCKAIAEVSTATNIIHSVSPIHFSGKRFTSGIIRAGNETMPKYESTGTMTGNEGNGHARITITSASNEVQITNSFTYTGKSARLPHFKEMLNCIKYNTTFTENNVNLSSGVLKSECSFLLENTKYNTSNLVEGYFIENPYSNNDYVWYLNSKNSTITGGTLKTTSDKYGVRPVIEVDKTLIEIY